MFFQLFIVLLLAVIGLLITGLFAKLVTSALVGNPNNFLDILTLGRRTQLLNELDKEFQAGNFSQALEILEKTFFFDPKLGETTIIEKIAAHHMEVLNRIVAFSDRHGFHLGPLPALEELLSNRSDLFKSKFEVSQTIRNLKFKKILSRNKSPNWALIEFKKKLADIQDKLETNRKAIKVTVKELFLLLHDSRRPDNVTFH
jgi:hypothetical protein